MSSPPLSARLARWLIAYRWWLAVAAVFLGAAANPFMPPYEFRPIRLAKKIEAWWPVRERRVYSATAASRVP